MEPPEDRAADEAARSGASSEAHAEPGPADAARAAAEPRATEPRATEPGAGAAESGGVRDGGGAGASDPASAGSDGAGSTATGVGERTGAGQEIGSGDDGDDGGYAGEGDDGEDLGWIAGLSLPSRIVIAVAVAAVAVGAVFHIGMVFLHVAPPNTLSEEHTQAVTDYIYPEFEQNWKLFAPNPVQDNTDVEARAEVRESNGSLNTTGWVDLTAMDIAKIRHDPIPSHTVQNELRRAWGFYTDSHDGQGHPIGLRGDLSQEYVEHIVADRFGPDLNGGAVQRVEVRVATTPVGSPPWVSPKTDTSTSYQVLPWWAVSPEDFT